MLLLQHDKNEKSNNLRDRGPAVAAVARLRQIRHKRIKDIHMDRGPIAAAARIRQK